MLALLPAPAAHAAADPATCGSLGNSIGPWDYRTERGNPLQLVESAHFDASVESASLTHNSIGGQLDYTLRAFPNHHRALVSMMRLGELTKSPQPRQLPRTIECYLERAARFQPNDPIVRMLYAQYLNKGGRGPEAVKQLEAAEAVAGDNSFTHYNVGLIYLEMKDYDRALKQAHQAYGLGMLRPELRQRLQDAGRWKEPVAAADGAASAASASAPVPAPTPARAPASAALAAASAASASGR